MNTIPLLAGNEPRLSPNKPLIYQLAGPAPKVRVAVFGSFLGGYHVLKELLSGELAQRVEVTGIATDDPVQPFTHPNVRLWKYSHTRDDELLVPSFAQAEGIPVFSGRVKTEEFYDIFFNQWRPDLCLMATFGQKILNCLIGYPPLGFFNFHHSAETWPSYPGPDPIAAMLRDGRKHLVLTIHKVIDLIDGGDFVARSHPVAIPDGVNAVQMHRITWPQMGPFIRCEVGTMLDAASTSKPVGFPMVLQEQTGDYRIVSPWQPVRLAA